jgi:hypothetical protein
LKINSNNFIALSYRAKALIATNSYEKAQEVIKLALSVKYSKSLIGLLKEVDEKINKTNKIDEFINLHHSNTSQIKSKSTEAPSEDTNKEDDKSEKTEKSNNNQVSEQKTPDKKFNFLTL